MNEQVKKRLENMKELATQILDKADLIKGDMDEVVTEDDLYVIEMAFDNIMGWAKEGYECCMSTYDEFKEEE